MQIELAADVEAKLSVEAGLQGLSAAELSSNILADYAAKMVPPAPETMSEEERDRFFERHIAWLKSTTPDWETRDPYAVDWQAFKAEGRKY